MDDDEVIEYERMKTLVQLIFDLGDDRRDEMVEIVTDAGCAEWITSVDPRSTLGGFFEHEFDSMDPRLETLKELLRERDIEWMENRRAKYSLRELKSFPLLALTLGLNRLRYGGGQFGTEYDFPKACPKCGSGAVQTSPLVLPAGSLPKTRKIVATRPNEILVAEPLASAMRKSAISGLELRQVISRRRKKPLPWWQIISAHEMPRMGSATQGIVRESCLPGVEFPPPCERCERDGHYRTLDQPLRIVYRRRDVNLGTIPDMAHTWELFGHSVLTPVPEKYLFLGYAQPLTLIGQRVFSVFRNMQVKGVRYEPVCVE